MGENQSELDAIGVLEAGDTAFVTRLPSPTLGHADIDVMLKAGRAVPEGLAHALEVRVILEDNALRIATFYDPRQARQRAVLEKVADRVWALSIDDALTGHITRTESQFELTDANGGIVPVEAGRVVYPYPQLAKHLWHIKFASHVGAPLRMLLIAMSCVEAL